jgi:hypothetical protein
MAQYWGNECERSTRPIDGKEWEKTQCKKKTEPGDQKRETNKTHIHHFTLQSKSVSLPTLNKTKDGTNGFITSYPTAVRATPQT